ncbi:hypothetical protein NECID01_0658 [Nematocida sp. AWRm77]|nr:hypothetical protein NECID01_0658 [Nematocida sp. AWRm77]
MKFQTILTISLCLMGGVFSISNVEMASNQAQETAVAKKQREENTRTSMADSFNNPNSALFIGTTAVFVTVAIVGAYLFVKTVVDLSDLEEAVKDIWESIKSYCKNKMGYDTGSNTGEENQLSTIVDPSTIENIGNTDNIEYEIPHETDLVVDQSNWIDPNDPNIRPPVDQSNWINPNDPFSRPPVDQSNWINPNDPFSRPPVDKANWINPNDPFSRPPVDKSNWIDPNDPFSRPPVDKANWIDPKDPLSKKNTRS